MMHTPTALRAGIALIALALGLTAGLPASMSEAAQPQQYASPTGVRPRIEGFDVEPLERAAPGGRLVFILYGTPGGSASISIGAAGGAAKLKETEPGVYEGVYSLRVGDDITPSTSATAELRLNGKRVSFLLDEPLIATAPRPPAQGSPAVKVEGLRIDAPARFAVGEQITLKLRTTPGAAASARIVGIKGKLLLREVRPSEYEGTYTIRKRDRVNADAVVTVTLRVGTHETVAVLDKALRIRSGNRSSALDALRAQEMSEGATAQ